MIFIFYKLEKILYTGCPNEFSNHYPQNHSTVFVHGFIFSRNLENKGLSSINSAQMFGKNRNIFEKTFLAYMVVAGPPILPIVSAYFLGIPLLELKSYGHFHILLAQESTLPIVFLLHPACLSSMENFDFQS